MQDYWTIVFFHTVSFLRGILRALGFPFVELPMPQYLWVCYNMNSRCLPPITKAEGARSCFSLPHTAKRQTCVLCLARGFTPGTLNLDAGLQKGWEVHTPQQLCPGMFLPNNHSLSSCFLASPAALVLSSARLFLQTSCTSVSLGYQASKFHLA